MGEDTREEIKRAFNADPAKHPLRILIATDAAREGVNLQNHCADLFHFDVPWNPGRMEQRNGRIDRKLQRSPEVRCHYFFHRQRPQDRVLQALVRKSDTIAKELGSLTPVVERRLEQLLQGGIRREQADAVAQAIDAERGGGRAQETVDEELEAARERQDGPAEAARAPADDLGRLAEADRLREDRLPRRALRVAAAPRRRAAEGRERPRRRTATPAGSSRPSTSGPAPTPPGPTRSTRCAPPRRRDQKPWDWRKEAKPRPVVFEDTGSLDDDTVHLHLEHRVVQRLLGRFLAQGFVHDDLSRACLGQTQDAIPRVLALGRLSLYGEGAARLHDEVLIVAARWTEPAIRKESLKPFGREGELTAENLLKDSLVGARPDGVPERMREKLLASIGRDMEDLLPHLRKRAEALAEKATEKLHERGEQGSGRHGRHPREAARAHREGERPQFEHKQLEIEFENADERRQIEADKRHWQRRLVSLRDELEREPERIRAAYEVKATRIEPLGIVYLWPMSG